MQPLIEKMYEYMLLYGMNIISSIVIFLAGKFLAKIIARLIERILQKAHVDKTLAKFIRHFVYFGSLTFVVVAAINKLGVETTSIVAAIGAAGLAVGLALQGSLANFAAGVLLIVFKPFKVGDVVEIAGIVGTVQKIQIFNTIILSLDNRSIIFPNAKITADKIINLSGVDKRRVDLVFSISYGNDIKKAKQVLEQVVLSDERVLREPKPDIGVSELGDSGVNIVCRPWIKPADYWNVYFDTLEKGKIELEKNGMTIPFPQRDVHLYQAKS